MKTKLLTLLIIALTTVIFTACEKEPKEPKEPLPTTYSITLDFDISRLDVEAIVFECNEMSEKINPITIENVEEGKKYHFTTSVDIITKIKIYYTAESYWTDESKWIQQVFILNKEGHTDIVIDENTMIGNNEP